MDDRGVNELDSNTSSGRLGDGYIDVKKFVLKRDSDGNTA